VSKGIRYDALLVRALAATLDARLAGRRIRALRFDAGARVLTLAFRDSTLTWDLHPDRGWIVLEERRTAGAGLALPAGARIARVTAPPDERLITFDIDGDDAGGDDGVIRRIVVELFGTHRNAIAVDASGIARAVLKPKPRADRVVAVTQPYEPLPPSRRLGAEEVPSFEAFRAAVEIAGSDAAEALLANVAYTGPLNAPWILGARDTAGCYDRWVALIGSEPEAWVLAPATAAQPYPARLDDADARSGPDLLAAFATAAALRVGTAAHDDFVARTAAALETVQERVGRAELRIAKLREQAADAPEEAAALRRQADLLLAQLHRVPKGADTVTLDDFEGGVITVALDPALPASANATRLYDAAKKRERAGERIPKLIRAAEREHAQLLGLLRRIEAGAASEDELRGLARRPSGPRQGTATTLPYRLYRTSGGLEVRVGRSNRANDDLTFHHSAPDDIWLHAESVPGAHVVLRWSRKEENPPASDLREAAVLAAVHSRARTSGTVAVTWTRRKYVRKPRKAPPGAVVVERGKTLFVEPSETVERALRQE
jgi:predicted ribosome quality control (RQC) complex YloA/Tae2 family protein